MCASGSLIIGTRNTMTMLVSLRFNAFVRPIQLNPLDVALLIPNIAEKENLNVERKSTAKLNQAIHTECIFITFSIGTRNVPLHNWDSCDAHLECIAYDTLKILWSSLRYDHPCYEAVRSISIQHNANSMQWEKYDRIYFFGSDRQQNHKCTCLLTSNALRPVSENTFIK